MLWNGSTKHSSPVNRNVAAFLAIAALSMQCNACLAADSDMSMGESKQQEFATPQEAKNPPAAEPELTTADSVQDNPFPFPIWRNRTFDDANDLAGVLLRTAEGPVQIKRVLWNVEEEEGIIYVCYLAGFTREGKSVTFGSPDSCLASVSKDDFLGSAMTGSDAFIIQSFDFATDHEGYLTVANPVFKVGAAARNVRSPSDPCYKDTVRRCQNLNCNTSQCGFQLGTIGITTPRSNEGRAQLKPIIAEREPVVCRCGAGGTGVCVVVEVSSCRGTCPAGDRKSAV